MSSQHKASTARTTGLTLCPSERRRRPKGGGPASGGPRPRAGRRSPSSSARLSQRIATVSSPRSEESTAKSVALAGEAHGVDAARAAGPPVTRTRRPSKRPLTAAVLAFQNERHRHASPVIIRASVGGEEEAVSRCRRAAPGDRDRVQPCERLLASARVLVRRSGRKSSGRPRLIIAVSIVSCSQSVRADSVHGDAVVGDDPAQGSDQPDHPILGGEVVADVRRSRPGRRPRRWRRCGHCRAPPLAGNARES